MKKQQWFDLALWAFVIGGFIMMAKVASANDVVQSVLQAPQSIQVDLAGTSNITYVGFAPLGTATTSPAWQEEYITWSAGGTPLTVTWCNGGSTNNIWTNHTSCTYQ